MSDVFHRKYRELREDEKILMESIKVKAEELYELYDQITTPECLRDVVLAKIKLEDSVMRAIRGLTK